MLYSIFALGAWKNMISPSPCTESISPKNSKLTHNSVHCPFKFAYLPTFFLELTYNAAKSSFLMSRTVRWITTFNKKNTEPQHCLSATALSHKMLLSFAKNISFKRIHLIFTKTKQLVSTIGAKKFINASTVGKFLRI